MSNENAEICRSYRDHKFELIEEKNLGPTDAGMAANGDCLYEVTHQCRHCGKIEITHDV